MFKKKKESSSIFNFSRGIEKITFRYIPKLIKKLKIKKTNFLLNDKNKYLTELSELINYSNNVAVWGRRTTNVFSLQESAKKNSLVLISGDGFDESSLGYLYQCELINKFRGNLYDQNSAFQINPESPFFKSKECKKYSNFLRKRKKNEFR